MAQVNGKPNIEFDPHFTDNVIAATGPNANARLKEVIPALIRHVHDFAREVHLTTDEFMAGISLLNWAGQMSNDRRNEGQLVSDVIGLESLVDEITYKLAAASAGAATPSAILGPFWRADAPVRRNGESICQLVPKDGEVAYMFGRLTDAASGQPLSNVSVDVWQASTNGLYLHNKKPGPTWTWILGNELMTLTTGLYEQQDPDQPEHNLRGKFYTDENGHYGFYCLRPTPYPVPGDGPAGKLLDLLDRHHYRPGHIHLIITKNGYQPITTQIFDRKSPYLEDDSVFAVKDGLTVDFVPRKSDSKASAQLEYDIKMAPIGK